MKWFKLFGILALLMLTLSLSASAVLAQGPEPYPTPPPPPGRSDLANMPRCIEMADAQIPGEKPGTTCRVPVVRLRANSPKGMTPQIVDVYRSGWTNQWTSESDSDMIEDEIKVEGYLYWWVGYWSFEDYCVRDNQWSSHAACRTYGSGGGSGSTLHQDGYHYFRKSGYQDQSFQTGHTWTV